MTLLQPSDLNLYGGTGTHSLEDIELAISLSEFDIEYALGTFLTPTTILLEEHPWPLDFGKIMLDHGHVNSITTVTAKHSLDADCIWIQDLECGVILDSATGVILVQACNLSLGDCNCSSNIFPDRAVITYVAGYTSTETDPTTSLGKALRMAIAMRAREWLQALEQGDNWQGNYIIESWSSMDYSERRSNANQFNSMGAGPLSQAAFRIIQNIRPYPAIFLRGSGKC